MINKYITLVMKFNGKVETFELHAATCRNMLAKFTTHEDDVNVEYGGTNAQIHKKAKEGADADVVSISEVDKKNILQYIKDNTPHFEKILSDDVTTQRKYIMAAINQTLLRNLPQLVMLSVTPRVTMMLIQNANYNNFVTEVQAEWMMEMAQ